MDTTRARTGDYLWLIMTHDAWGMHPIVFRAGETIDPKTVARRLSLPFQGENGQPLVTLRLGRWRDVKDLSVPESEPDRIMRRRYQGGS